MKVLIAITVAFLLVTSPVWAQVNIDDIRPDNVQPLEFERPIVEYICAVVFLLAALGIGFKPSRRTND